MSTSITDGGFLYANTLDNTCHFPPQSVEGVLGNNNYQHNKVNQWTSAVVEQCLNQLTKLGKPFKYIGEHYIVCVLCSIALLYY